LENFTYDPNGNVTLHERINNSALTKSIIWDEANRIKAVKVGRSKLQHNIYDASGERVLKGIGYLTSVSINGEPIATTYSIGNYTTYVSGDFVVDGYNQVSKHYFMGSERIASRLSGLYDPNNEKHCHISDEQADQWIGGLQGIQHDDIRNTMYKFGIKIYSIQNDLAAILNCNQNGRSASESSKQCECFYHNICRDVLYYYHSDHIGSSTFLTDALGNPYEFMLYLPD